jgi:glyoxylase-like metal-dependent hydrolase (beta-lactamase superfamily II)
MEIPKDSFPFKVGGFECVVVSDRVSRAPEAPPEHAPGQRDLPLEETINIMCLFIRTGGHNVLIDTGCGVGAEHGTGKLMRNLQAEGIPSTEIDTVILSHGHGDHIGGNTDAQGSPAFPNAQYIIHKKEWEFWTSEPDFTQFNFPENVKQDFRAAVQKNLIPIQKRFRLIGGEMEIVPGIGFVMAPGHTPGHMVITISSGAEKLFCFSDLFHDISKVEQPDSYSDIDMAPEQAIRSRIHILSLVARPDVMVFAGHFPFPGLGHIAKRDDKWLWQPIEIES